MCPRSLITRGRNEPIDPATIPILYSTLVQYSNGRE